MRSLLLDPSLDYFRERKRGSETPRGQIDGSSAKTCVFWLIGLLSPKVAVLIKDRAIVTRYIGQECAYYPMHTANRPEENISLRLFESPMRHALGKFSGYSAKCLSLWQTIDPPHDKLRDRFTISVHVVTILAPSRCEDRLSRAVFRVSDIKPQLATATLGKRRQRVRVRPQTSSRIHVTHERVREKSTGC